MCECVCVCSAYSDSVILCMNDDSPSLATPAEAGVCLIIVVGQACILESVQC